MGGTGERAWDDLDYARVVTELVEAGFGEPKRIFRVNTHRQFQHYVDALRYRRHTERGFAFTLAGGDAREFPDFESAVEAHRLTPQEIEAALSASPFVVHAPEPSGSE